MCYKYKNPHGFQDMREDYCDNYNFCPYCGKKLEVNADER